MPLRGPSVQLVTRRDARMPHQCGSNFSGSFICSGGVSHHGGVRQNSRLSIYSDSPSPVAARPGTLFTCATTHRILVDNQIRPTTSGTPVNDTARISRLRMDRSELFRTTSRPAVFMQERCKVHPCFTFVPGVAQRPGPTAFRLVVRGRGRVDDHPDGMSALLGAEPEPFGNESSGFFCLFGSPQLKVELEHGSEIVVEREATS